jgi:hypothetical protein
LNTLLEAFQANLQDVEDDETPSSQLFPKLWKHWEDLVPTKDGEAGAAKPRAKEERDARKSNVLAEVPKISAFFQESNAGSTSGNIEDTLAVVQPQEDTELSELSRVDEPSVTEAIPPTEGDTAHESLELTASAPLPHWKVLPVQIHTLVIWDYGLVIFQTV